MNIKKENLKTKINQNIYKTLNQEIYTKNTVKASKLLTYNRFDLIAKYLYVKFKIEKIDSSFGKEIYLEHIKAFNGFIENDESNKVGQEDFLNSCDNLIDSISKNGFDEDSIVPLSDDNTILDGAHRTAISLYLDRSINVIKTENKKQVFDYKYFQERGLVDKYLDAMAYEYARLKDNCFMVLIWPRAQLKNDELVKILNEYGNIVYNKNIDINYNGMVNLVKQAYSKESWIGNYDNDFEGARNKAKWCYQDKSRLRVYLLESDKDVISMKDKIRNLFQLEKHAVHINDTKEETLELAELLFNNNSIHWLNAARLKKFNTFDMLFSKYNQYLKDTSLDKNNFCLVGAVLSVYGVKETSDIDYINIGNIEYDFGSKDIELETSKIKFTKINTDDIINNPKYYFTAFSHKFISLELIRDIKKNRKKGNDEEDIILLNKIISNGTYEESFIEILQKFGRKSFWKRNIKFLILKIRFLILMILKKIKGN